MGSRRFESLGRVQRHELRKARACLQIATLLLSTQTEARNDSDAASANGPRLSSFMRPLRGFVEVVYCCTCVEGFMANEVGRFRA